MSARTRHQGAMSDDADTRHRLTFYVKAAELTQRNATAPILDRLALSYAQFSLLLSIARAPGLSSAALARLHGITAQSCGEVIGALARRDLIARGADPRNRRIRTVTLTPHGAALIADIRDDMERINDRLTAGIPAADLAATRRTLIAIVRNGDLPARDDPG